MLSEKQMAFVNAYTTPGEAFGNNTKAAIMAGYAEKSAYSAGARLLKNVKVAKEIRSRREATAEASKITRDKVLQRYIQIAFTDIDQVMNNHGSSVTLKNFEEMGASKVAISEMGMTRSGVRVKMHDKLKALESIREMTGMTKQQGTNESPLRIQIVSEFDLNASQ